MTVICNNLPFEIWAVVFTFVGRIQTLAECRLVCKNWDPIAERAMFNRSLTLEKEEKVAKFCNMLKQKPSVVNYVCSLEVRDWIWWPSSLQQDLFAIFEQLKNLECLELYAYENCDILEADHVLDRCPNVKTVYIALYIEEGYWDSGDSARQWMIEENIQQSSSVIEMGIYGEVDGPEQIEYLAFKYPNARSISIRNLDTTLGGILRVFQAVKSIPYVEFSIWCLPHLNDLRDVLSVMKCASNTIAIRLLTEDEAFTNLYLDRNLENDSTTCRITLKESEIARVLAMASQVYQANEIVHIDYRDFKNPQITAGERTSFEKLIAMTPRASSVKFCNARVVLPQSPVNHLVSYSLKDLEICGAVVDEEVLSLFSQAAPNLKHIKLNTCVLDLLCPQDYHIKMPSSDLDTLSIVAQLGSVYVKYEDNYLEADISKDRLKSFKSIQEKVSIRKHQILSLRVSSSSSQETQHFALKPGSPVAIKAISQEDHLKYTGGWPTICIECSSLKVLKLDLGELKVKLDLDIERPIESMHDWMQASRLALLQQLYP